MCRISGPVPLYGGPAGSPNVQMNCLGGGTAGTAGVGGGNYK